jgi:HK97 family phage major capsid protein
MKRSTQFRQRHAALVARAETLLAAANPDSGELSETQQAEYDGLKAQMATLKTSISREEDHEAAERSAPAASRTEPEDRQRTVARGRVGDGAEGDPGRGFRSHRDFLLACMADADATDRDQVSDERLKPLFMADTEKGKKGPREHGFLLPQAFTPKSLQASVGSDEQGAYSDQYGGAAVRSSFLPGILTTGNEGDPTVGKTQSVPMETPSVEILARVDKDHSTSVSGGFTVARRAETGDIAATRGKLERITLKANSLFGLAYETEELITDSPISFIALIDAGFRTQFGAHMLREKIRGTGAGEYQGVLTAPCTITVSKETNQTTKTINYQNTIKMLSRIWGQDQSFWMANHDTRPQLSVLAIPVGTGGTLVYQPSREVGFPDMLHGRPVVYTEFASKLGDLGDLMLTNWSQYLDGLYQPLQSAESVHVRFLNHERAFKMWLRNAGAPWWRSALTPNQSTVTMSPFVILEAR